MLFTTAGPGSLGVTGVAAELGMSKASVHRILTALRRSGLVVYQESTRRYVLGPAALALGNAYLERLEIRRLATDPMRRLVTRTQETATLSVRAGTERIYLEQILPDREVRATVSIGHLYPLHAGSSSKVLLAFLGTAARESYLSGRRDGVMLRRQLDRIRERGYAVSFEERIEGVGSVAAPVFDRDGGIAAVMSVCGPVDRLRPVAGRIAALLLVEADGLSHQLGYRASPLGVR